MLSEDPNTNNLHLTPHRSCGPLGGSVGVSASKFHFEHFNLALTRLRQAPVLQHLYLAKLQLAVTVAVAVAVAVAVTAIGGGVARQLNVPVSAAPTPDGLGQNPLCTLAVLLESQIRCD